MKQVPSKYHFSKKYASMERFISYFYQVHSVYNLNIKKILFIGVGDGVVPYLLKRNGEYEVTTLDFDPDLRPDFVADVRSLPFKDKSFDLVCVFEVLEHIPYEDVSLALKEIVRVTKKDVVISVPHRRTGFEIVLKFPFIRSIFKKDFLRLAIRFPIRFPGFAVSKQHYWEIDSHTTKLSKFREDLRKFFVIIEEITPVLDFYKRFFCLTLK